MPAADAPPVAAGEPTAVARVAHRIGRTLGRVDLFVDRLRPWMVLGPLVVAGWLVMADAARLAVHNGWVYYHGGDGTWYYTTGWVLGQGKIPYSAIGYGYPLLLAPLLAVAGPSMLVGLPAIVVFNAVVLAPIALLCVYGLARFIAGQRFAYVVSVLWVVMPLLGMSYFYPTYHQQYVDQTLPNVLGLTALGDYPSMVCLLVAAYFTLRAAQRHRDIDALTAGLVIGFAIAIKPSNAIFLPAPIVAFALARRPRIVLVTAAGIVPSVAALTLWKYRGLGIVPLFAKHSQTFALGPTATISTSILGIHVHNYLHVVSWSLLKSNIDGFREWGWSKRLLEWALLAGLVGLGRRSLRIALFVAIWLATYVVIKGGSVGDMRAGGFLRYVAPSFPAAFLLVMSVVLLIPVYGRRLAGRGVESGWPSTPRARHTILAVAAVVATAPLLVFAVMQPLGSPRAARDPTPDLYFPANAFPVQATASAGAVTVNWPRQPTHGARVLYAVFREHPDALACSPQSGAALDCTYPDVPTAEVSGTSWTDHPGRGTWTYRVAVAAPAFPPLQGNAFVLLSRPATVDVGR